MFLLFCIKIHVTMIEDNHKGIAAHNIEQHQEGAV